MKTIDKIMFIAVILLSVAAPGYAQYLTPCGWVSEGSTEYENPCPTYEPAGCWGGCGTKERGHNICCNTPELTVCYQGSYTIWAPEAGDCDDGLDSCFCNGT